MEFTIFIRKMNRYLTFSTEGNHGSYVFVDLNGKDGYLGEQLVKGGRTFAGESVIMPTYQECSKEIFEKICRKWYRQFMAAGWWKYYLPQN